MIDNKKISIRFLGASIVTFDGLSGHADQQELVNWLNNLQAATERIFIVHGEPKSSIALQQKIQEAYGWESEVAALTTLDNL